RIEIAPQGTAAEKVSQELFIVRQEKKEKLLMHILDEHAGSVLLFIRTKHQARKLTRNLRDQRFTAAEIHSERSLGQRREALEGFKNGRYRVLVATDIAARGIDVKGIELVINYDLPDDMENYIHRIGRTGRAGMTGTAISFATPDQGGDVNQIERIMKRTLAVRTHPEVESDRFDQRSGGGSGRRPQRGGRPPQRGGFGGPRPSFGSQGGSRGPSSHGAPRGGSQGPSFGGAHSSSHDGPRGGSHSGPSAGGFRGPQRGPGGFGGGSRPGGSRPHQGSGGPGSGFGPRRPGSRPGGGRPSGGRPGRSF
ncbi:MAG: RNA helicase, partial [Candidatus Omnitrophica bacterium]|nr:RNA helicase [Candidatus Omnitrophota bacterium]